MCEVSLGLKMISTEHTKIDATLVNACIRQKGSSKPRLFSDGNSKCQAFYLTLHTQMTLNPSNRCTLFRHLGLRVAGKKIARAFCKMV